MKKLRKIILYVLLVLIIGLFAMILFLTLTEYKPQNTESVDILHPNSAGYSKNVPEVSDTLSVITWNIGYAGLSETADFFMDGGKGVRTQDRDSVYANLDSFVSGITKADPDILFLQEIDRNSDRSYHIDETAYLRDHFAGMDSTFAGNFNVIFVPYPLPPIGKVDSGIMTMTDFSVTNAERIQLPVPFSWPIRTANLKRCILVERISVNADNSNVMSTSQKELVLINLHLEAYDDGSGKEAQTKMLSKLMQEEYDKGNYVVAGGDFNQSFSGTDTSMYPLQGDDLWQCGLIDEASFSSNFRFLMDNTAPTCRSLNRPYDPQDESFQYYMIDGFIVSDNIEVVSVDTLDYGFRNSDHNPVRMVFSLQ